MSDLQSVIFAAIIGEKKYEILCFLLANSDKNGFINIKISQICKQLNVSKPTVIDTFKLLENKQIFERIKNGVYRFRIYDYKLNQKS